MYRFREVFAVASMLIAADALAQCQLPTIVALRFPACHAAPKKASVRVGTVTAEAIERPEIPQATGYLIATGAPPFNPATQPIDIAADGAPIRCGATGKVQDLNGVG